MALPKEITLNVITDKLKELADCHQMINDFEVGETAARGYSDKQKKELIYPYLWVDYAPALLNIGQSRRISDKIYNLRLFVADKHTDNVKLDDEIMSDTEGILSDIISKVLEDPELKNIIINPGTITLTPAREETKDDVFGWIASVPFRVPYKFCYKDLPIIDKP